MSKVENYLNKMVTPAYNFLEAAAKNRDYNSIGINASIDILSHKLDVDVATARMLLRKLSKKPYRCISSENWRIHVKPKQSIERQIQRRLQ